MSSCLNRATLCACASAAVFASSAASAQAANPAGDAEPPAEPSREIADPEVIIVTAQRRSQSLQDAPVAVTALTESSLAQLNVSNSQDLMQVVPSLQVSTQTAGNGTGSATFFLRGMGQQRSGNGSEPAVGIYVDDFYYPSLSGSLFDIVDLDQVEVLRGPQGTLFGRNTIGGAIRYTTTRAELDTFTGHVNGTVGSYQRYDISGSINVPIGSIAAVRLTAGHLQRDGYVKVQTGGDDAGATKTDLVRGQIHIEPSSTITADFSAQWSREKLRGFTYTVPGPITPLPLGTAGEPTLAAIYQYIVQPLIGTPAYTDALRSKCFYCQPGTANPEFSETTYKNALATVAWDFTEGLTLKSLTGWQQIINTSSIDYDSTIAPIIGGGTIRQRTSAFSQEIQLNGRLIDSRLNFVMGGYYYNQRDPRFDIVESDLVLGGPAVLIPPENRKIKSYAGFVDASFDVTDRLTLLGGYRYSEDKKNVQSFDSATGDTLATTERRFASSTFRGGAQYEFEPDFMAYATVATGFRAGGFNPYDPVQSPPLQSFEPEESTSYELGLRIQFLNRRITVNPTVFHVDWSKIQVQKLVVNNSTNGASVILQNAGRARSNGFELEWSVEPTDQLRVFGNLAYLDMKYTDVGGANGTINLDTELQRAPPMTFSIGAAHTIKTSFGNFLTTLNYSFQDDQYSTPALNDRLLLPAYALLNARIEYTTMNEQFSIAAFATNLTDEEYYIGGVNFYTSAGAARYDVGRPQEFGVSAKVRF